MTLHRVPPGERAQLTDDVGRPVRVWREDAFISGTLTAVDLSAVVRAGREVLNLVRLTIAPWGVVELIPRDRVEVDR